MFVNLEIAKERYSICKTCENFAPTLKICRKCGCLLPAKVTFSMASCPIGKWSSNRIDPNTREYTYRE